MACSWKKGACDVLQAPAQLCLVRAATDNDLGGSDGTSHAARWLGLGLDRELVAKSCTVTVKDASDSLVTIEVCLATACAETAATPCHHHIVTVCLAESTVSYWAWLGSWLGIRAHSPECNVQLKQGISLRRAQR